MALEGFVSSAREELKRDIPYKQELIQAFTFAAWVIAIANGSATAAISFTTFLNILTSILYHAHNYCWGKQNESEWSFIFIVFSFSASLAVTMGGVAHTPEAQVICIFNWFAFALFAQDEIN